MKITFHRTQWTACLATLLISANLVVAGSLKKGDPFPDLGAYGLEGRIPELNGKVVLVDFFASWCGPCQESFPAMEELYQKYREQGVVIIAVNLDKNEDDMKGFLKEHPASFVILRDAAFKLAKKVDVPTMPSSFLLDRSGKVYAVHRGFRGSKTVKEYTEEIDALLK